MSADFRAEKNPDAGAVPKRVAFIKGRTAARVRKEDEDLVMTVPHLVVREAIAFMAMVIVLALLSLFFNAPLGRGYIRAALHQLRWNAHGNRRRHGIQGNGG